MKSLATVKEKVWQKNTRELEEAPTEKTTARRPRGAKEVPTKVRSTTKQHVKQIDRATDKADE